MPCLAEESVLLCKQSSCQAEKREQMAAARYMLGFIADIFQKNTESRADPEQAGFYHSVSHEEPGGGSTPKSDQT